MDQKPVDNPLIEIAETLAGKLLSSLTSIQPQVLNKYKYYDADQETSDLGISTPRKFMQHEPGIGWAERAVNTLADRIVFDGFAKDNFGLNAVFEKINAHSVISQAKNDGCTIGCAFVAIADDPEKDRKIFMPFAADEATGVIDQTTGLLRYGLAVTQWREMTAANGIRVKGGLRFEPRDFVLFTPNFTAIFINRGLTEIVENPTGRCMLLPFTHRATARQPLGKSRLTKTARRVIQEVGRLKRREEIAEEFYSMPQRYVMGLAEGTETNGKFDSALGKVWTATKDDEGDAPTVGQLQQMSIDGFIGAKKDKARDFCAATGLTLRNLGYETGNPTSAESLSAMSDDLLLEAQNTQEEMGKQIKQLAITYYMAVNGIDEVPDELYDLTPAWKPIFQLDVGAAGDAVGKVATAMPEIIGTIAGYRMLGVSIREAEELQARRLQMTNASFMNNGGGQ